MIDLDKTHAIAALNAGQSNPTDEGIRFFLNGTPYNVYHFLR